MAWSQRRSVAVASYDGYTLKFAGNSNCTCCDYDPAKADGRKTLLQVANGVANCKGKRFETADNIIYRLFTLRGEQGSLDNCIDTCSKATGCLGVYFQEKSADNKGAMCRGLTRIKLTTVDGDGLFPHPSDLDDVSYAKDGESTPSFMYTTALDRWWEPVCKNNS